MQTFSNWGFQIFHQDDHLQVREDCYLITMSLWPNRLFFSKKNGTNHPIHIIDMTAKIEKYLWNPQKIVGKKEGVFQFYPEDHGWPSQWFRVNEPVLWGCIGPQNSQAFGGSGSLLGCPWKLVTIVSKLACFTYLGDVSNLLNLLILGWNNLVTKYQQDIQVGYSTKTHIKQNPERQWEKGCGFPYMGVSKNRGTPKWMIYNGNPY